MQTRNILVRSAIVAAALAVTGGAVHGADGRVEVRDVGRGA